MVVIMHRHFRIADIISMEPLNLKVIRRFRAFQQLVLNLLDDNIFTVKGDENIPRAELAGTCPALDRRVERVIRRAGDFVTSDRQMNPFFRRIPEGLNHRFERGFSRFGVSRPHEVACLDVLNCILESTLFYQSQFAILLRYTPFLLLWTN